MESMIGLFWGNVYNVVHHVSLGVVSGLFQVYSMTSDINLIS